jgi:hypothetical protein
MAKLGFTLHARVPSEWGMLLVHALERPPDGVIGAGGEAR